MSQFKCVPTEQLQAFLLGDLAEAAGLAVALHLADCPVCEAQASRLDALTDPLLLSLRRAIHPDAAGSSGAQDSLETVNDGDPGPRTAPGASPWRLAGYEVVGELGRGGMSVVYKARQDRPARLVALKMILAGGHASQEQRARFLTEADAIARLQHPNIVGVFEVGFTDDVPFFSLELVEGGSLAHKLAGTPQPPRQAAALVETLARAAHYAHQRGVIHRDLKPGNVLLTAEGAPKIADFGLARLEQAKFGDSDTPGPAEAEQRVQTVSGTVLGTPSYMAPEQAQGKSRQVGPAADTYALGAVLYECLSGRPPFWAESHVDTLMQVMNDEPVPPRRLNPKVPHDLETICLKCLNKVPARRYGSAAELADDLARWLQGKPIRARPVGLLERGWRWCRTHTGWAAALLLLIVVATGSLVAAWWLYATNQQLALAERASQEQLLDSLLAQARSNQTSGQVGQRFDSLDALRRAAQIARQLHKGEADILALRKQAIACLALPDLRVRQEWAGNPPGTTGLCFNEDFSCYAWSSADGIHVRRLADHQELFRFPLRPAARSDSWISLYFSRQV